MFKYFKYIEVKKDKTILKFRSTTEDIKVNYFTGESLGANVVSISHENEDKIDSLVDAQEVEINCVEITQEEFKTLVKDSDQINRIRDIVKGDIALKYSPADEIALIKKEDEDEKKIAYNLYIDNCIAKGNKLKSAVGY